MNQNEHRPRIDISTMLPVGIGAVSLFGICLLLLAGRLSSPRSTVQVPDTATPFRYLFIGTEPGISSAIPSTEDGFFEEGTPADGFEPVPPDSTPEAEFTPTPRKGFSITAQSGVSTNNNSSSGNSTQSVPTGLSTEDGLIIVPAARTPSPTTGAARPTKSPTNTFVPTPTWTVQSFTKTPVSFQTLYARTNTPGIVITPSRTPTSASTAPLNAGTYDDTDSRILYSGNWTSQSNVGNAYQGTLHVSTTLGNTITFRFIGQEIRLFYIAAQSLGTIRITIDQKSFDLLQNSDVTAPSEWVSDFYPSGGTHTVTIQHLDGGSVNLDQVIVPEIVPTSTPDS